jgi:small subunit ribosomal protein S9
VAEKKFTWATGRRKNAVARIRAIRGTGRIEINGRKLEEYFTVPTHRAMVARPMILTGTQASVDIYVNVTGGGVSGQAGAIRHGIARVLNALDTNNRMALKTNGLLTRDPRMVERKKYGHPGARKRFQFSKR